MHSARQFAGSLLLLLQLLLLSSVLNGLQVSNTTAASDTIQTWIEERRQYILGKQMVLDERERKARTAAQKAQSALALAREEKDAEAESIANGALQKAQKALGDILGLKRLYKERLENLNRLESWSKKTHWYGIAGIVRGDVYKVSSAGEQTPIAEAGLVPGDTVQTGRNGFAEITFPDGSTVSLGPNSAMRLRQEEAKPATYGLVKGRLHFLYEKRAKAGSEPVIHVITAIIAVRGTELHIEVNEDNSAVVSLLHGRLELTEEATQRVIPLRENMQVRIDARGRISEPVPLPASNAPSWWEQPDGASPGPK